MECGCVQVIEISVRVGMSIKGKQTRRYCFEFTQTILTYSNKTNEQGAHRILGEEIHYGKMYLFLLSYNLEFTVILPVHLRNFENRSVTAFRFN
jgi:hypothetical protein